MRSGRRLWLACLAAAALCARPALADAQHDANLFRGQTISILTGAGPGGGADIYSRLLANYYGQFLPGDPSMAASNVPGAGGLELANRIYNLSPRDGTEIGTFLTSTALEPLYGVKDAQFQPTKFTWIGDMSHADVTACVSSRRSGIKSWKDLEGRMTTFGASGPTSGTSIGAKVLGALFGFNIKVIEGYQGTRTSNLAMQRGELDATCGLFLSTIRSQFMDQVKSGELIVWMTFGEQRAKEFPNTPTIYELIKNSADRQLAQFLFDQESIVRPYAAPPGLSQERTAALRNGFMDTMKDPAFLAVAKKAGLSIDPVDGEETQKQYQAFYNYPKSIIDRAKAIIGLQ